jgi:membrane-associated phospholipid phosphatase
MWPRLFRRFFLLWAVGCVVLVPGPTAAQETVQTIGDVLAVALPASAGIATLALKDYHGTRQFLGAFVVSQGTVYLLKHVIDRERPDGGRYSFPSGHSASAFLGAGFVHRRYGFKYAWPMYALATFVGWSRVYSDKHYTGDVIAGAAISVGTCWLLVKPRPSPVQVSPAAISDGYGIRLCWTI